MMNEEIKEMINIQELNLSSNKTITNEGIIGMINM
jgi:hypothetical protein